MTSPRSPVRMRTASSTGITKIFPSPTSRSEERRVGKECRSRCDWSSDVCSSDLPLGLKVADDDVTALAGADAHRIIDGNHEDLPVADLEIGRASCRERV